MIKWIAVAVVTFLASASLALTPQERDFAVKARGYMELAKQKAIQQEQVIDDINKENEILDQIAQGQRNQIINLSDQIDRSHKNEEELAKYNAYAKPIVEQVNKWCGLGAFGYGIQKLSKCLFMLIAVLAGVAVALFVLTLVFPEIRLFLKAAFGTLAAIVGRFKKK